MLEENTSEKRKGKYFDIFVDVYEFNIIRV